MPTWLVRATWNEDETETTECWEVNAENAAAALKLVMPHLRFPPRHVEARLCAPDAKSYLRPGESRCTQRDQL
jgi:hypothetical protein